MMNIINVYMFLWKFMYTQPKRAGIFILSSGGEIPPRSTEHLEVACNLDDEDIEIHPFRFRTHTHNLGLISLENHSSELHF